MALRKSKQVAQRAPAQSPLEAGGTFAIVTEHVIVVAEFLLNDVIEMGALPAGCVVVSPPTLTLDDLDTGATLTLDVGLLTGQYLSPLDDAGAARVCGQEFLVGSTLGQAGGTVTSAVAAGMKLVPVNYDRSFGIKIAAAAAGAIVGAKLRFVALVANAPVGM